MDAYKETFETWNKIASLYQDKFMNLDLYDETYDLFCTGITGEKTQLLEIGCGPGNISRYLLSMRPDLNIYGIDIAPNMVALARVNNPTARFDVLDCRLISSIESTFDGIVCGFCLPYLSPADASTLMSDCFKLLTTQGLLYLSFVEGDPGESGFQSGSSGDGIYFYYYNLNDLIQLLIDNNFEKPAIFNIPYKKSEGKEDIHTVFITKKNAEKK